MEKNPLLQFGNIPVQAGMLATCFGQLASPAKKLQALEKDGQIIRLKRGLYVVDSELTGKPISAGLCANHIYGPSYVSQHWALRWYGLIPEHVVTMTSVTTKRSRRFENAIGWFEYEQVPAHYFPIGVTRIDEQGLPFLMATPEKALCDMILHDMYLPDRSVRSLGIYLEEDLRFDTDALKDFDVSIIEQCAHFGRKENILNNLIKIIKQL